MVEVYKDGVWAHALLSTGASLVFKVHADDFKKGVSGIQFTAYHPLLIRPTGLQYLPTVTETNDPWVLNPVNFIALALIQENGQKELDEMVKRALNPDEPVIERADPMQTPEARRKLLRLSKQT